MVRPLPGYLKIRGLIPVHWAIYWETRWVLHCPTAYPICSLSITHMHLGVYIYGLYLDGAGWDKKAGRLMEPPPKLLYNPLPVVHLSAYCTTAPGASQVAAAAAASNYSCPVYKKPQRTDLNYIFPLQLKTNRDPNYWVLRGVALLCDVK